MAEDPIALSRVSYKYLLMLDPQRIPQIQHFAANFSKLTAPPWLPLILTGVTSWRRGFPTKETSNNALQKILRRPGCLYAGKQLER